MKVATFSVVRSLGRIDLKDDFVDLSVERTECAE